MKRLLLFLFCLWTAVLMQSQIIRVFTLKDFNGGKPCGKMTYLAIYEMKHVDDTTRFPYHDQTELIRLEIGDGVSRCWGNEAYQADSINRLAMSRGDNHMSGFNGISWQLVRGVPKSDMYAYLERLGMERFVYTETVVLPDWEILSDSVSTLSGYPCNKAEADYCGRKWTAWYTDDIPLDEGPWKLKGLPGLVLKAEDSQKQFVFTLVGIHAIKENVDILYFGDAYETISKAEMQQVYKRYYADPTAFVTANPGVRVTITDEHGNAIKGNTGVPYNLLER